MVCSVLEGSSSVGCSSGDLSSSTRVAAAAAAAAAFLFSFLLIFLENVGQSSSGSTIVSPDGC